MTAAFSSSSGSPFLQRHQLVWLKSTAVRALGKDLPDASRAAATEWLSRGWPAVVRRRDQDAPAEVICIGIPLPPHRGGARVALTVPREEVARMGPPPALEEVLVAAPHAWRTPLQNLEVMARSLDLRLRVCGSLAWQHLTGEPHLRDGSDLDLLFAVRNDDHLQRVLEMLVRWEKQFGLRPDGEIGLPDGLAIAWRELLPPRSRKVLVKSLEAVSLLPVETVLSMISAEEMP